MDRLSALDVSFLTNESSSSHMHVGAILIFEGPPPSYDDLLEHVSSRLHLVPRFRQKLEHPPLPTGRPFWIDDPAFNLEYHVRHSALPGARLRGAAEQDGGAHLLPAARPDQAAVGAVAGAGADAASASPSSPRPTTRSSTGSRASTSPPCFFDVKPVPEPAPPDHSWVPSPEPSGLALLAKDAEGLAAHAGPAARDASSERSSIRGRRSTRRARRRRPSARSGWAFANPAPKVPLNVEIGSHRRYAWVRSDLARFKRIKDALGGTVNDVVLAVVSGALRRWLHHRGIRTEGLELRAQVPVSIRAADEHGHLGNRIAAVRGPLPVYIEDPVERLRTVREGMEGIKQSKQALGAEVISRFNDFAPPTLLAQASRINFSTRLFNLVVTNVPGPQMPLYVLGRELEDVFPVGFLPPNQALFVAIMSYNGRVNFGLLADFDSMQDIDVVAEGIEASIAELAQAANETTQERAGGRPATVR